MPSAARTMFIVSFLLTANVILVAEKAHSGDAPNGEPQSIFACDVPTWMVGDTWNYETHLHLVMGLNVTNLMGSSTYQVTDIFAERQNGTLYEMYNVTVNGTFTGNGYGTIGGIPFTFTISSANLTGYQWFDRSNLALVRDNETIDAQGTVRILFMDYPLKMKFDSTSNRSSAHEDYDFPLLLGDVWSYAGNMRSIGYYHYNVTGTPFGDFIGTIPYDHNTSMDFDAVLEDVGDLLVKGKTYYAYHVNETPPANLSRAGSSHLWFAPEVKNTVRQYTTADTVDYILSGFMNLTTYTINPEPFPLSMDMDPQMLNPGGYLNITGNTNANAAVKILTPWNESSASTIANPSGNYFVRVRAPTFDDYTPTNADVGSHGAIVEAISGVQTSFNASTIVLLMPDLSVTPSDLNFSSPPVVGIPTTILAVVHESSNVGVHNNVTAEFIVDGMFLATDTVPFFLADGQRIFSAAWTPTPGLHTIGVRVDPLDEILESDESNNYAEMPLAAALPDLVPWNITVTDGVSAFYNNPASTGYISQVFEASLGEQLSVSFKVINRGNATANGTFKVIVVKTAGLRGPPSEPPILNQTFVNETIQPLETVNVTPTSWPIPATIGMHYYNLTVDANYSIMESAEGNNTFVLQIEVGAPDLIVSVSGPSRVPIGGGSLITVIGSNIGNRTSPATVVEVRDNATMTVLSNLSLNLISVGGSQTNQYDISSLTSSIGQVCLQYEIDTNDTIQELNEYNNIHIWCFEVTDLPVTNVTIGIPKYQTAQTTFISNMTDITFQTVDNSGTGIKHIQYSVDGGPWTNYNPANPLRLTGDGSHTIGYNSTDNVGGAEETKSISVVVDATPPISTGSENNGQVSIGAGDTGCGINATYYRLDSGQFVLYSGIFEVTTVGDHIVEYYSVDNLGNTEQTRSLMFTVSDGGPSGDDVDENLVLYIAIVIVILIVVAVAILLLKKRKKPEEPSEGLYEVEEESVEEPSEEPEDELNEDDRLLKEFEENL